MRKFRESIGKQSLLAVLVAGCSFLLSVHLGKMGDCAPGQVDGQCGLWTFMGVLMGALVAGAIVVVSAIAITIAALRRRQS